MKTIKSLKIIIFASLSISLIVSCEKGPHKFDREFSGPTKPIKVESFFINSLPAEYCGIISEFDLIGGQTINMGKVQVARDAKYLYVKYLADPGYVITETHLFLGPIEDMPKNGPGNPQIGHFPYKFETDGDGVESVIHKIDLNDINSSCFDIVAHAVVKCADRSCETMEETAWAKDELVFSLKAKLYDAQDVRYWMSSQENTSITTACDFTLGYNYLDLDVLPDEFDLFPAHLPSATPIGSVTIEKIDETLVFTIRGHEPYDLVEISALFLGQLNDLVADIRVDNCFNWGYWTNYIEKVLPFHQYTIDIPNSAKFDSSRWGFYIENYCLSTCD